jgi:two-component system CheB/CheR fusion protein
MSDPPPGRPRQRFPTADPQQFLAEASAMLVNPDPAGVVPSILALTQRLFRADACVAWRRHPRIGTWEIVAEANRSAEEPRELASSPQPPPGLPVCSEDRGRGALLEGGEGAGGAAGFRSPLCLPLPLRGEQAGALALYYREPRAITDAELGVGRALANLAAVAIATAELDEEQRRARGEAEAARQRLAFLAEASSVLASSPDLDTALERVARLAVPTFADWCLVHRVDEHGAARAVAVEPADPARGLWARELPLGCFDGPDQPRGLAAVLRTGRTELYPEVPDDLLIEPARSPGQLAALREVGFSSCLIVPLRARDQVFGAITFVAAESGARYGESDVRLAEDLAHRAAAAIDSARLYREAEGVLRERRQAAEGLRAIAARARCLLWYAEVEDRGERTLHWTLRVADEEAARRFLPVEVPPEHTYGQALAEARLPEDRARMVFGDEETRAGRSYRQEFRIRDADGRIRWLAEDVQIEAIGPNRWYAVGICVDVSERQRLEEALRQRAEALAEADRRKDEFLAMLAHELRNPLGAITNSLAVLQHPEAVAAARSRALSVLDRQVRHQGRMVEDLLDVSRITRGLVELRREPLDLAALVCETIEDYRAAFRERGVELAVTLPDGALPILGDRVRLSQVLGNLLSNALKFTPPQERVVVSVERGDGEAAIRLRDTGIGIPAELLPHVFDSFTQGDRSLVRAQGGLGLGLALVRGLVQLHGGSVAASSDGPGHGAEFVVRLPVTIHRSDPAGPRSNDQRGRGAGEQRAGKAWAGRRCRPSGLEVPAPRASTVLVVEDNRDAAETMRDLLELAGHVVELAHTGPEGIDAARRSNPDVVLCDIGLPGMDGHAVAVALRQDPLTARARLIAISGYGQETDRQRSREAGFDHHLVKPIAPQRLYDLLAPDHP